MANYWGKEYDKPNIKILNDKPWKHYFLSVFYGTLVSQEKEPSREAWRGDIEEDIQKEHCLKENTKPNH